MTFYLENTAFGTGKTGHWKDKHVKTFTEQRVKGEEAEKRSSCPWYKLSFADFFFGETKSKNMTLSNIQLF